MSDPVTRALAEEVVNSIGVALYLRDGCLSQHGPGELVEPRPGSLPQPHGVIDPKDPVAAKV